ncbi:MAG: chaperone NapD [Rhizobiaceae bacterium]|nr:chaperone NapD [Rhizobiaceae bacterium]
MSERFAVTRRSFITGAAAPPLHVSSAVVVVFPERRQELSERLAEIAGVEVHAGEGSRIVLTIEGPSSEMLGGTLIRISAMEGVIAANMVFEHIGEDEASAT